LWRIAQFTALIRRFAPPSPAGAGEGGLKPASTLHAARTIALFAILTFLGPGARAEEVARAGPFTFHSSFWINLHETLIHFASPRVDQKVAGFSEEEQRVWSEAAAAFRKSPRLPQVVARDLLSQVPDDGSPREIEPPLGPALLKAAPIYRRHFWPAADRANRFWIAYTAAMVGDAGEDLIRRHEKAFAGEWPKTARIDATAYAEPFGARTIMGDIGGVQASIAAVHPNNLGLAALEVVFHETSHDLVGPRSGRVAEVINREARKRGIEPPRELWHALLFATSSELTRQALRERGVAEYQPFVYKQGLYDDWPRYRAPIEAHWLPYLNGKGTFEEAIAKIVEAAPRPR
jgi:hypothetical protein